MTIDDHVRQVVAASGLGRTLFVEAGAGTGKTTSLVERIANLVLVDGVSLANIAAITFTDAAASELRDRVRLRFEREVRDTTDPQRRDRASAALVDTDLAAISTLHSFAQRILGEHPARSGLPPRLTVLDEVASTLEREDRWGRFVDGLHADPANEALLERAALLNVALEPSYFGQPTFKDVAQQLGESWDRLGPVASHVHPPLPPVDLGPLEAAVADLEAAVGRCDDHDDRLYCRILDEVLPEARRLLDTDDPADQIRLLATVKLPGSGRLGSKKAWGDADAARAVVGAVDEARIEVVARAAHEVLVRLTSLVAADLLAAAERRRVEGRLQFHDLLVLAKRLLERSPEARDALHQRYTRLLLDEFQDTDPLQIHLAVLIASSVSGEAPHRWEDAEVPEGRLFFVGDPKQSIYRFRRADISLFLAARDRFGAGDATQRLSANFRTVVPVVEWVNATFGDLMAHEVADMQPAYEALHGVRTPPSGVDARPVLLGGPHDKGTRAPEIRAVESAEVVAVLHHLSTHPEQWPVGDPEAPGGWRPARLSDVTILIPTRTELPALEQALRERHLPYHLATGTLIYESQEVRDALAVLSAVADPGDQLALIASLRSPLYGCSDVHLAEFKAAGGRFEVNRTPPESLAAHHPVVQALAHIRSLWEQRWWEPPSRLLTRLLQERAAAVVAFGEERPAEAWSRLRYLVDQVRLFEESNGGDLRQLLRWVELQRDERVTVHQPVAADGSTQAVSIMTIHGAKGLEFPITVLSGMSARPPVAVRGANVIFDDADVPGVAIRKGVATNNHRPLADLENDMAAHERLRLLYVAATRARDHLVVSCHHGPAGGDSFASLVWAVAQAHPDTWRRPPEPLGGEPVVASLHAAGAHTAESAPSPGTAPAGASSDGRQAWAAARAAVLERQGRRRVTSATAVARQASGIDLADEDTPVGPAADADDVADPAGSGPGEPARRRGRAGTAIGRAVHATLQLVDLHEPVTLVAEASRQAELEAIPELTSTVADMARSALESHTVRSAQRYHREVYVAAPVGQQVLEGYVDLLVETPDGLVVVDYKTDTVRSEAEIDEKLAAYELQGAAYAVALETVTGLPVVGCRFVFCRPGGAIEREVADLPATMERVRQALA